MKQRTSSLVPNIKNDDQSNCKILINAFPERSINTPCRSQSNYDSYSTAPTVHPATINTTQSFKIPRQRGNNEPPTLIKLPTSKIFKPQTKCKYQLNVSNLSQHKSMIYLHTVNALSPFLNQLSTDSFH